VGPVVEGAALVSQQGFSARYDLDRERGVFSRPAHDLYGHSVVGKVLVCTTAKGGIATSWMLLDMVRRGVAPLALLFRTTNPVMVQGAVLAGLPLLHRLEPDPQGALRSGDYLRVDPAAGTVEVLAEPAPGEPVPEEPGGASSRSS
jgi:predicted aconitase with swiveling domain